MNWVLVVILASNYAGFQSFDTQASCEAAKTWVLAQPSTLRRQAECFKK